MPATHNDLIALYQLHAELADRVSQRREGANRLFVTLLTSLIVVTGFLLNAHHILALLVLGITGVGISVSWYIVIRSYRQLNSGKFKVLFELETQLPFAFFTREWAVLKGGRDKKHYWKLTVVETFLPLIFAVVFLALLVYIVFSALL